MSNENSAFPNGAMWVQMERQDKRAKSPEKAPVLQLMHFTPTPKVCFGNVKLGQSRSMQMLVHNPQDIDQELKVHKFPKCEEFTIDCLQLGVDSGQSKALNITWKPVAEGNRRELFGFLTNTGFRTHVVLLGTAVQDKSAKKKKLPLTSINNRQTDLGRSIHPKSVEKVTRSPCKRTLIRVSPPTDSILSSRDAALSPNLNQIGLESGNRQADGRVSFGGTTFTVPPSPVAENLSVNRNSGSNNLRSSRNADRSLVLPPSNETFIRVSDGNDIPECLVPLTPERRQTFVKRSVDHTIEEENENSCGDPNNGQPLIVVPNNCDRTYSIASVTSKSTESRSCIPQLLLATPFFDNTNGLDNHFNGTLSLGEIDDRTPSQIRRCSTGIKSRQPPLNLTASMTPIHSKKSLFSIRSTTCSPIDRETSSSRTLTLPTTCPARRLSLDGAVTTSTALTSDDSFLDMTGIVRISGHDPEEGGGVEKVEEDRQRPGRPAAVKRKTIGRCVTAAQRADENRATVVAITASPGGDAKNKWGGRLARRSCRLTLIKPVKTDIPRHPNPFASSSTFYDDQWMQKQERGFMQWLNYVFTPTIDDQLFPTVAPQTASSDGVWSHKDAFKNAPSKEQLSVQAYREARHLNRLRKSAVQLFNSPAVVDILLRIEKEVDAQRLAIRKDKALHLDIGMKDKVLELLAAYNVLWLKIAFETVFGEVLPCQSLDNHAYIRNFLMKRMMNNDNIRMQYAHSSVPNLTRPGFELALKKFILKKFIFLVLFLDKAKEERLIDHDPCLFNKNQKIKSTRGVLLEFSRCFLSGEGDITKHLAYLGFAANHKQGPLDELEFTVANIAVDLRDGTRLARVLELLLRDWNILKTLRVPASTTHQKVHNVNVVLQSLAKYGVPLATVTAREVVDGHREKTLALLWHIILHFQVDVILKIEKIEAEVARQCLQLRKAGIDTGPILDIEVCDREIICKSNERLKWLLRWCRCVCAHYGIEVNNFSVSFSDGRALCYLLHHYHPQLLLAHEIQKETTQSRHHHQASNSDVSRLLFAESTMNDSFEANWTMSFNSAEVARTTSEQLVANERANFQLFLGCVSRLGGIPDLFAPGDMVNTIPNEKNTIIYLSYLCTRIMEDAKEIHAVTLIQRAWRRCCRRRVKAESSERDIYIQSLSTTNEQGDAFMKATLVSTWKFAQRWMVKCLKKKRNNAATVLQVAWRAHRQRCQQSEIGIRASTLGGISQCSHDKDQEMAAIVIQRFVRRHLEQRHVRLAAIIICQSFVRGFLARRKFMALRAAVVTVQILFRAKVAAQLEFRIYHRLRATCIALQAHIRGRIARCHHLDLKHQRNESATTIQRWWLACHIARAERRRYMDLQRVTLFVQDRWRCLKRLERHQRVCGATLTIQRRYRARLQGRQEKNKLFVELTAATAIQVWWRHVLVYRKLITAAITIQRHWRLCSISKYVRVEFLKKKYSAILIQSYWRGHQVRQELLRKKSAAILVQSYWRGQRVRQEFLQKKTATIRIQSYWRGQKARQEFLQKKTAVIIIQSYWRGQRARQELQQKKAVATLIQSYWRGHLVRQKLLQKKSAIIVIQSYWRGQRARQEFLQKKTAAIIIQSHWRGHQVRQELLQKKSAAILVQSYWRGQCVRQEFLQKKTATIIIQSYWRGQKARQEFLQKKTAVIIIQSYWKGQRARQELQQKKAVATLIQSYWRGHLVRQELLRKKSAIIVIQSYWRGQRARQEFLQKKTAAIIIQSYWRGHQVRQELLQKKAAAILIQSYWKGQHIRREFLQKKTATIIIQSYWRGQRARQELQQKKAVATLIQSYWRGHLVRQELLRKKSAIIAIQSYWRGQRARQEFLQKKTAAIIIQSYWRGHQVRQELLQKKAAAILIQSYWKGQHIRREFLQKKTATIIIQSYWRGQRARQELQQKKAVATLIQSYWRGHLVRQELLRKKSAIIVIQSYWRGQRARQEFQQKRFAATIIQSYWKGQRMRREFLKKKSSAILIQSFWRGQCVRQEIQQKAFAATIIQSYWRGHLVNREFRKKKSAAILIQSYWRGQRMRREFVRNNSAASVIQRWWLGGLLQRRKEKAAVIIQCHWRGFAERNQLAKLNRAAVLVQSYWRGFQTRKLLKRLAWATSVVQLRYRALLVGLKVRQDYVGVKRATLAIQRWWRGIVTRRRQEVAAISIQRYWRGYQLMRVERHRLLHLNHVAILLQSRWRGQQTRKELGRRNMAALSLQKWYRLLRDGRRKRSEFLEKRKAAVVIQQYWRCYRLLKVDRQHLVKLKWATRIVENHWMIRRSCVEERRRNGAATIIQMWFCSAIGGRRERVRFLRFRCSAIDIQIWWRDIRNRRKAALTIQAFWRGYQQMIDERRQFCRLRQAAVCLQSSWRARQTRICLERTECVVRAIQAMYCAKRDGDNIRRHFLRNRSAALSIQRWWRRTKSPSVKLMREDQECDQDQNVADFFVQCQRTRLELAQLEIVTVMVQRRYRARKIGQPERNRFLHMRRAAVLIQVWWRRTKMDLSHATYRSPGMEEASLTIQRWWRRQHANLPKRFQPLDGNDDSSRAEDVASSKPNCLDGGIAKLIVECQLGTSHQHTESSYLEASQQIAYRHLGDTSEQNQQHSCEKERHLPLLLTRVHLEAAPRGYLLDNQLSERRLTYGASSDAEAPSIQGPVSPSYPNSNGYQLWNDQATMSSDNDVEPSSNVDMVVDQPADLDLSDDNLERQGERRPPLDRDWAATIIQSYWRGHRVRCAYQNTSLTKVRSCIQQANACAIGNAENQLGNRTCSSLQFLLECRSLYYITCAMQQLMVSSSMSEVCCQKIVDGNALETIVKLVDNSNRSVPHIKLVIYCISVILNISKCAYNVKVVWESNGLFDVLCNIMNIYHVKEKVIFNKCCSLLWNLAQDPQIQKDINANAAFKKRLSVWHTNLTKKESLAMKSRAPQIVCLPIQPDWVLGSYHLREFKNSLVAINSLMYILQIATQL